MLDFLIYTMHIYDSRKICILYYRIIFNVIFKYILIIEYIIYYIEYIIYNDYRDIIDKIIDKDMKKLIYFKKKRNNFIS